MIKFHSLNNFVQVFEFQKQLIEELYRNHDWQTFQNRNPEHSAVIKHEICERMIKQGGSLKKPEDKEILPNIASTLLDTHILSKISSGNPAELLLGNFANYGDIKVRKQLDSQLLKRDKFLSLMTELSFGAWFLNKDSFELTATEDDGLADFKITLPSIFANQPMPFPLIAECKHLSRETGKNGCERVITKANKQIRNWGNRIEGSFYGLVAIEVSSKISFKNQGNLIAIRSEIEPIIKVVQNKISRYCTSVSAVLLMFDMYSEDIVSEDETLTNIVASRNGVLIKHSQPLHPLPIFLQDKLGNRWGYQAGYQIKWQSRAV